MGWQDILYGRIYVDFSFLAVHNVCTKAILLGERSVRIREVKGSNPSRSTFSSSVILTLLLFFCIHISHTLALGPGRIRTALPCCRQGKLPARFPEPSAGEARPSLFSVSLQGLLFFIQLSKNCICSFV